MTRILLCGAAAGVVLSSLAGAQIVVKDGDVVSGVGNVVSIQNLAVNDSGSWIVEAGTDNANADQDEVMIADGALLLREDDAVAPAGARIDSFDAVNLNASGDSAWNFFLAGTSGGSDDSGVYFNSTLVLQEGSISTAAGFTSPTPYVGFSEVKINGSGDALVMASVDDPAVPSTTDRALVVFDLDGAGTLLSETIVATEGDTPGPLLGDSITDLSTGPHQFAFNDAGDVAYRADVTTGSGGSSALFLNATLVARAGGASPIASRNWETLIARAMALNNAGELLFLANLTGSTADDEVLFHRDAGGTLTLVAREGDPISTPDGTFLIETFGSSAPLGLSDGGDVLYHANWDDPDTSRDSGWVFNGELIVQEGKTLVGGQLVVSVGGGVSDTASLSPNGQHLLLEVDLTGNVDAAVLIDPAAFPYPRFCDASDGSLAACPCSNAGNPDSGCDIPQATGGVRLDVLAQTTGPNRATVTGTGFNTQGSPAAIVIRSNALDPARPVVFGDGLRCIATSPLVRLAATPAFGGVSTHAFGHGTAAGSGTFYYQIWFRSTPSTYCDPAAAFNVSNGRAMTW